MRTQSDALTPADLRPMPYGRTNPRHIKNGIWEPIWGGLRVLVHIRGDEVVIRDQGGEALDGFDPLCEALREAALADELVLDGALLPGPLRDTTGAVVSVGLDAVPTFAQVGRHFLMGGAGAARRDAVEKRADEERAELSPELPAAFVAIDLLWLDGEPILDVPLAERKRLLDSVLSETAMVRRTVWVRPPVESWFSQWRALGFSEAAVKGANSRYTPGDPSEEWAIALMPKR